MDDTQKVTISSQELAKFIREKTGLIISAGNVYRGNGNNFIRINLACPLKMVKDGMARLATATVSYTHLTLPTIGAV